MANVVHYYYPTPTVHHHPKHGMIKIGNILTNFKTPESPVALAPAIPPPADDPQTDEVRDVVEYGGTPEEKEATQPPTEPTVPGSNTGGVGSEPQAEKASNKTSFFKVFSRKKGIVKPNLPSKTTLSWQKTVDVSTANLRAKNLGVFTRVTGVGGGNINLEWTEAHDKVFSFERVVTVEFWPSYKYIDACFGTKDIESILQLTNYKPLYLITGIKTVTGAQAQSEDSKTMNVDGSGELDASGVSGGTAPIQGGTNAGAKKEDKLGVSYKSSSDFVFAFRVKKITVSKKTKEAIMEDMTKGTLLDGEQRSTPLSFEVEDFIDASPDDLGCVGHFDA
jgi:hypothetical protein